MKIPKRIKIFDVWFSIRLSNDVSRDKDLAKDGVVGCTNSDTYEIVLDQNMTAEALERTFYHEVVHAIMRVGGLTEVMSSELEEGICEALGHALPQIVILKRRK